MVSVPPFNAAENSFRFSNSSKPRNISTRPSLLFRPDRSDPGTPPDTGKSPGSTGGDLMWAVGETQPKHACVLGKCVNEPLADTARGLEWTTRTQIHSLATLTSINPCDHPLTKF